MRISAGVQTCARPIARASLVDRHVQSLFFNMAKIAASGRLGQFDAADDAMLVDQVLRFTTAAHGFREANHRNARKSDRSGKSGSVSVDPLWRRINKKKEHKSTNVTIGVKYTAR